MAHKMDDLISKLIEQHSPRPWWKGTSILLSIWLSANILGYVFFGLWNKSSTPSRGVAVSILTTLILALSCFSFRQLFYPERRPERRIVPVALALLGLVVGSFVFQYSAGHMASGREAHMTAGDWYCLKHTLLLCLWPVVLAPFFLKQFFLAYPRWGIFFFTIQTAVMAIVVTELRCGDRQAWHLLLGHQSTYLFLGVMLGLSYFAYRRLRSL